MVITPHEKSWGPDYLRFGLGLETDFQGDNSFNVLVQYRKSWLNRLGAEWMTEAQVGEDTHLYTEFFQPLHDAGIWFGSIYGKVGQQTRGVFDGDDKVADYRVGYAGGGLDVGAILGTMGILRVGPLWNQVKAEVETGDPLLPSLSELTAGGRVALAIDQLDHAWFPQSGLPGDRLVLWRDRIPGIGARLPAPRGHADLRQIIGPAHSESHRSRRYRFRDRYAGVRVVLARRPAAPVRIPGGPVHRARVLLRPRDVLQPGVAVAGSARLGRSYLGGSAEIGRIVDRVDGLDSPGTLYSGSVFLGADTFIGPAYLGVGAGSGGSSVYLLLGAP